ncbi:hypothetical protein WICPIJ_003130 [Wickerhamomyces pijperi]|uniref:Uncharacterized protein n=1 Tax=Wickerhamomyces pijperi TaxID=599730 RepID=A0A9P8QAJ0_WICPI|nr:hypothetical protein WICPIJ_003130 [Wickerhamomyces pijperi]
MKSGEADTDFFLLWVEAPCKELEVSVPVCDLAVLMEADLKGTEETEAESEYEEAATESSTELSKYSRVTKSINLFVNLNKEDNTIKSELLYLCSNHLRQILTISVKFCWIFAQFSLEIGLTMLRIVCVNSTMDIWRSSDLTSEEFE